MNIFRIIIPLGTLIVSVIFITAVPNTETLFTNALRVQPDSQFSNESPASEPGSICFSIEKKKGGLEVTIDARTIKEKILGLAFDLSFDRSHLTFVRHQAGKFFEQSGATPIYLTKEGAPGTITAGISLRRGETLPHGSGRIISFQFKSQGSSYDDFSVDHPVISTLTKNGRRDLPGIPWLMCNIPKNTPVSEKFLM